MSSTGLPNGTTVLPHAVDASTARIIPRDPRRLLLAGLGLVAVGLGGVGAIVPGMPTTVFLLIASYCFAKSCPWLEQRLLGHRLFAPYVRVLDPAYVMSTRARLTSLVSMWVCVATSLLLLLAAGRLSGVVGGVIVATALVGTVAILLFRRGP